MVYLPTFTKKNQPHVGTVNIPYMDRMGLTLHNPC